MTKQVNVEVVIGADGPSLYVDDYRVLGNKPWGGGRMIHAWKVDKERLIDDLRASGLLPKKRVRRKPEVANES